MKNNIITFMACIAALGLLTSCGSTEQPAAQTTTTTAAETTTTMTTETTTTAAPETTMETVETDDGNAIEDTESQEKETPFVVLTAGQPCEYSEELTLNAGTETEETQYVYYLPAGNYTAKNTSKFPAQINIYSRETHVVDGGEEPLETIFVSLIMQDDSVDFSIEEDQYIEIHEPDILEIFKKE